MCVYIVFFVTCGVYLLSVDVLSVSEDAAGTVFLILGGILIVLAAAVLGAGD